MSGLLENYEPFGNATNNECFAGINCLFHAKVEQTHRSSQYPTNYKCQKKF